MKKLSIIASMTAVALLTAGAAPSMLQAQEMATSAKQANNAIKFRKSVFQLIRSNIGPLGAMAKGQIPYDVEIMSKNAERMMQLSAMVPDYMALDTTKFNQDSSAKSEIWSNLSDFNQKAQDLYEAAAALKTVADAKDEGNYRAAIGKVGGTCKACHDEYKAE